MENSMDAQDQWMSGNSEEEFDGPGWIHRYCAMRGNEYFCEVDNDFILDRFNLTGLGHDVPNAQKAYDLIVDSSSGDEMVQEHVESAAKHLFGLIHQRFIITPNGLSKMLKKIIRGDYGKCPRVFCEGQHLLPVGLSDIKAVSSVKLFCPNCEDVYNPRSSFSHIDGAYFGTTFPHLLLQTYRHSVIPSKKDTKYVPRIFGFRLANIPE